MAVAPKPTLWNFVLAFREHLFAGMSGGASVPFAALAVFLDNSYAKSNLAALAFTCAGFAGYRMWRHERARVRELEQKLEPAIRIFLDPTCDGVRVVPTLLRVPPGVAQTPGPDTKWVQIMVGPTTEAPLVGCEARLKSVERLNEDGTKTLILDEPIYCPWSNVPPAESTRITIPAGITQPANLVSVNENDARIWVQAWPAKVRLSDEIQKPGKYRFEIGVTANSVPTLNAAFVLVWKGSYDDLGIVGIKEDKI
jgi:hypothetical protein